MKRNLVKNSWKRGLGVGLSVAMTLTMLPAVPAKAAEGDLLKAGSINATAETVTEGQPFAAGTAGSSYFRIPAFIVTQDGNLVAAADARYETTGDGGGLDTIASMSDDGGRTWKYSFPLYFPDSKGYAGPSATTIIDPVLVQGEDGAIYCMADVNPTGVTTMGGYTSPNVGTGYIRIDGKDRLALTSDYANVNTQPTAEDADRYEYYVGDFNDAGYAPVVKRADGSASEYAVDVWYNLYSVKGGEYVADLKQKQVNDENTEIQQNVFYKDSKLHVYNTGYLMYARSVDDGLTWGDPEILNPQIKRAGETGLLVSPGKGTLVSDGTIVIPFYEHGLGEENASIIWSDDNGETWSRSNDIPGSDNGGFWSSESEVVELKDGTLRMFFRNGQGVIAYADASRNSDGDFVFAAPKATGVACTSTCNVTASIYSKEIDGKQAILVGAPGGPNRANGKLFTFLADAENGNKMTLKSTYSIPESAAVYQYSCMDELPDAGVGLLWENGAGSIVYDSFDILELVPNGYIPGAETDVTLNAGESYTREYAAAVPQIQQQPDETVATIDVTRTGGAEERFVIPLYAHISNADNSRAAFAEDADAALNIADAEFTVTSAEGEENAYTVFSETTGKYLLNLRGEIYGDTATTNMIITKTEGSDTFRVSNSDGRYVYFHKPQMNMNAMDRYIEASAPGYELTLLEKKDTIAESDPVPGYDIASAVTSGRKYLITYLWEKETEDGKESGVVILYPGSDFNSQTKLVGEAYTETGSAITTLTITGVGEGETTAVVDGMTYHITCLGNQKITLRKGEKYFIAGATAFESENPAVVKAEAGEESRNALFDCEASGKYNFAGYSEIPNWDIDMSEAEFVVEESGENAYTIFNPSAGVYLTNYNASQYFQESSIPQILNPVDSGDGVSSFEIIRTDNNRYCYFFYERMAFDALSTNQGIHQGTGKPWAEVGDFGFEFLEKSDTVTNLDPIPGYRLVSEITPGKTYLITEYYTVKEEGQEDVKGIIVLYPRVGIENQSKLYKAVDVPGVYITALADSGTVKVTIDGEVYEVQIEGSCPHEGAKRIDGSIAATCTEAGYSGDTYCSVCGEKIAQGEATEPLGHNYDNGKVTKPVTVEEDGVMTFTCKNDSSHTYTEVISSYDFAWEELNKAITSAEGRAKQTDIYTESTLAELNKAIQAAKALAGDAQKSAVNAARENLTKAEGALVTKELQEKIDELTALVNMQLDASEYSEDTFAVLTSAITSGKEALERPNATVNTLKRAIDRIHSALENLVNLKDVALGEALTALGAKIDEAAKLIPNQAAYSAETFAAFKSAYDNAVAARDSEKIKADKDAAAVNDALAKLTAAMSGLKAAGQPAPPAPVDTKTAAPAIKSISVSAAKNGIAVKITVSPVDGAARYAVYRVVNGKAGLAGSTAAGKTVVTDQALTGRKASYYAVALDAAGKEISDKGAAKEITLESAIKIKKVSSGSSGIKITWNKTKKATGYIVYRSTKKNGSYTKLATVKKSKAAYTDKKAAKGKTYYYKIVYKTKNGVSAMSAASKKAKRKK